MEVFSRNNIRTMRDLVYTASERFGDDPFVRTCVKKEMHDRSFNEFRKDCDALGAWLQDTFDQTVHAVLIGATSYEYMVAWFGISISGNVSVPLSASNSPEALADEIIRSDSEIVFIDSSRESDIDKLKTLCPNVKYFVHITGRAESTAALSDILSQYSGQSPSGDIDPQSMTAIIFTSGTTGKSKGVMLSHANIADNATCEPDNNYHGDKRLSILPIHHIFCFICDIAAGLWFGRIICINDSLMRIPKNLKQFRPAQATVVPMIAASILSKMQMASKTNPDKKAIGREVFGENFKTLYVGGSYLSPEIIEGYREFGISAAQGYGMTECSARISSNAGVNDSSKNTSVGHLMPGCIVKTVDGELWVKSPSVMLGYYKNPEETAKTLTPDDWLKTGDLGYVDDEGFVYLTGRKKNLIILSNGENVSPEELENKFACFEPVKEIVVYDKEGVITAEVYPNPDYEAEDIRGEIQDKINEINDTLIAAKQIHALVLRDTEFEKTSSKKIKRNLIGK